MVKIFFVGGALAGVLAVLLGAFATHGLRQHISVALLDTFKIGVQYQMYHAFVLLLVGILLHLFYSQTQVKKALCYSGYFFIAGIILFSGSLYLLALTKIKGVGFVTPLGGVFFIAGWLMLILAAIKFEKLNLNIMDNVSSNTMTGAERNIKSFVIRSSRMTKAQQRSYNDLWPIYGLESSSGIIDFQTVFGNNRSTVIEIGFGMGDSLIEMAKVSPETNFIGIDVHRPGVGRLLSLIEKYELKNLKVYRDDAIEVLQNCITSQSLIRLQLFFPDPWHKRRHNKRRIMRPEFVALVRDKLVAGGVFHVATDWKDYAQFIVKLMTDIPGYKNQAGSASYSEKPSYRPKTKFERRGEYLGHGVWDLLYARVDHTG